MKLYRVKSIGVSEGDSLYQGDLGTCYGFSWHMRRHLAEDAAEPGDRIEAFEFRCSAAGVLELLRRVASHPDNG